MGYKQLFSCDRDLCEVEAPTVGPKNIPATWIGVSRLTKGRAGPKEWVFCSWVCADIEVSRYAEGELDATEEESR